VAVGLRAVYVTSGDDRPWVHALGADGSPRWHLDLPVRDQLATDIVLDDSHLFVSSRGYGYRAEQVSFLHRVRIDGAHLRSTPVPAPHELPVAVHSLALGERGALLISGAVRHLERPGHDIFTASLARDGVNVAWWSRFGEDGRVAEHGVRLAAVPSGGLALLATREADDHFAGLLQRLTPRGESPGRRSPLE
jgi:hypothetical protein